MTSRQSSLRSARRLSGDLPHLTSKFGKVLAALAITGITSAFGQPAQWNGSVSSEWENGANWNGGTVPASGTNVRISNPTRAAVITTNTGTPTLSSLSIGYLGDGTLIIEDDGALTAGIFSMSFSGDATLIIRDGGQFNSNYSNIGQDAFSQTTVTVDGVGSRWTNTFGLYNPLGSSFVVGEFDGSATLNVTNQAVVNVGSGSGTIVLGFDFGTSGTLNIGSGTTAAGIIEAGEIRGGDGNATVNFNHTDSVYDFDAAITGSAKVNQLGTGNTTLFGTNTYTGTTSVTNGTLSAGADNVFSINSAHTVAAGGTLDLVLHNQTIGSIAGAGRVLLGSGTLAAGRNNSSTIFSGTLSEEGSFRKEGTGTLTLSGSNIHSGATQVAAGTLRAGATNTFSSQSTHETRTGATLDLANYNQTIGALSGTAGTVTLGSGTLTTGANNATTTFAGTISGSGSIVKTGSGTFTLSQANSFTGGTTISQGALQTTNIMALNGGNASLASAGRLVIAAGTSLQVANLNWESGGTIELTLDTGTNFTSTGTFTQSGTGAFQIYGFLDPNTEYALLTFQNAGASYSDWIANIVGGLTPSFRVQDNGDNTSTLFLAYMGAMTGPVINNYDPDYTPTNADFLVVGAVIAERDPQQVDSLTFVDGGSVTILETLRLNAGTVNVLSGTGTVSGGPLTTPGDFLKIGDGLLNLQNTVFAGGNTFIQAGGLAVNGTLFTNTLFVGLDSVLRGNGLINGNVVNAGTVAPGNSPGTLTVNGNFTQTSTGLLEIEIASAQIFDRLIVTGQAALGGTLQAVPFGGYNLAYGDQYAFLQAGSITGDFDQILMPNGFRGRFLVEGGTGTLVVAPESYIQVAQTTNQRNVAKALDSFIPASGNDRETVSIAFDLLSEEQYPTAFDKIAPSFHESLANITIEQAFAQTQQINQRLSAVRLGARGFQAIGIESPLVHDKDGKSVAEAKDLKSNVEAVADTHWNAWVTGNGLFGRVTNVSQVPNYNFNSGGFLVGVDYAWSENFTTGLYGGYQYTYADYNAAGNTQINSALFGGYATYDVGGFYADAVVGGGYNGYRARRGIEFGSIDRTARSQPNGGQFNAALNLGYDWEVGKFTFGPIAGVQYTYAGIAPFSETGADSLDLRVAQQNANSLRTTFGGRVAYTWNITETIALIPEVRMFWQHEFLNNPRNISSALDGGAGPTFGYETSAPARDSVFAGAGVSAQFGKNWNAFFYYNADFGRQDYTGHMISGGVNWKF